MSDSDRVCLDASVALAFVLEDEPLHEQAKQLIRQWAAQNVTLCAPAMFAYECDSIIRLRVYKKALTLQKAEEARAFLDALGITIEYDASDRTRAYQIATDYDQPRAYDAAYAAHAEARGVELVTTDAPFFEAVNGAKKPKKAAALTFVKLLTAGPLKTP